MEGRKYLNNGQIIFAVMAKSSTNEPNPDEQHDSLDPAMIINTVIYQNTIQLGETAQKSGDYAEDMAMEMLATSLGLTEDPSLTWNEREEQWRLSGKIYKTQNFTQSAEGHKDGLWTTVLSAAVFVL